ncbi:MAG: AsmA family protein [Gammaproteobacteria bacterium]
MVAGFLAAARWAFLALLLAVLSLAAVLFVAGEDFYKQRIIEAVEAASGRALRIDGAVTLRSILPPRVSFGAVRYPNAEWSAPPWAFEAEAVSFELDARALLQGELAVRDIVLVKPKLWVEKNAAGVYNLAAERRGGNGASLSPVEWLRDADPRILDGEITVISRRRRWDLRLDDARAELDAPDAPITVKFRGALEGTSLDAVATIGSLEDLFAMRPSELMLEGAVGHRDNHVRATGRVGNLLKWRDVDLRLRFAAAHPDKLSGIAGRRVRDIGMVTGSARFRQDAGIITNRLEEIELESSRRGLRSTLSGKIGKLHGRAGYDMLLSVRGEIDHMLPQHMVNPGAPLHAELRARLHGALDSLRLTIGDARATNSEVSVRAHGELRRIKRGWGGELPLSVTLKSFGRMSGAGGRALAPLAPLNARGMLVRAPGGWQLRDINMSAPGAGFSLSAQGMVGELNRLRGFDLAVRAQIDDVTHWPWGAKLPPNTPLQMRAHLRDDAAGGLDLNGMHISLAAPQFHLAAHGALRGLGASMRADLGLDVQLDAAAPLRDWLPHKAAALLQPMLPLRASARLRSSNAREWSVSVASQPPSESKSARAPDGKLQASFDWVMLPQRPAMENLSLSLDAGHFQLRARGGIGRLQPLQFDLPEVAFEAERIGTLRALGLGALHPGKPLSLKARIALQEEAAGRNLRVDIARLTVGGSDVRGVVSARMPGEKTQLRARADLQSDNFDLAEIFAPVEKNRARFFPTARFNTAWIPKADLEINLRAAHAGHRWLDMRDVVVRAVVKDGVWRQSIGGAVGAGAPRLHLAMNLDANAQPPALRVELHGRQLDTAGLRAFRKEGYLDGGVFHAGIDVTARGDSLAEFAASADGSASLRLDDTRIKNQAIDVIGGDIFSNILTAVNPFHSIGEYVDVECARMQFEITDGIAAAGESLALKTARMTVRANGSIDLADESLQFLISPKARKGLGINSSSLVKLVRVGGTLAQPQIETDVTRLLQTGAVFWAALYSGGWTLLAQGLFDRASASADVCGREVAAQRSGAAAE